MRAHFEVKKAPSISSILQADGMEMARSPQKAVFDLPGLELMARVDGTVVEHNSCLSLTVYLGSDVLVRCGGEVEAGG